MPAGIYANSTPYEITSISIIRSTALRPVSVMADGAEKLLYNPLKYVYLCEISLSSEKALTNVILNDKIISE